MKGFATLPGHVADPASAEIPQPKLSHADVLALTLLSGQPVPTKSVVLSVALGEEAQVVSVILHPGVNKKPGSS